MRGTPIEQASGTLKVSTGGPGFTDITTKVADWLTEIGATDGVAHLFMRHTSASLLIQENADPDVLRDLVDALSRLAPEGPRYRHDSEGPDDMPAHIKAMLLPVSVTIPVASGRMRLGTWQGIYVAEHRARPHTREIALHYMGARAG
jgi:secondary thiamine-phosphate synthase enzyme